MKKYLKIGFALCIFFSGAVSANDQVKEFFNRYIQLGESFDPSVASLYADTAQILAFRVYPHGLERSMELTGAQWKQLIQKVMPLAKAQNDKSTFSNVVIAENDGGFKIKADRYSVRKCYTDSGYYMVARMNEKGSLEIVKEYMETKPLPSC